MAFDAAQILRQTYAAGAEAAQFRDLAEPQRVAEPAVQRGEIADVSWLDVGDVLAGIVASWSRRRFCKRIKHGGR